MFIHCENRQQFYDCIAALVERGLGFEADAWALKITLTGAY